MSVSISTTTRAIMTKCVSPFEIGAMFSVLGSLQAMMPLMSSPLYGFMYKSTIKTFPATFLYFNCLLYAIAGLLLVWVYFSVKKIEKKEKDLEVVKSDDVKKTFLPN